MPRKDFQTALKAYYTACDAINASPYLQEAFLVASMSQNSRGWFVYVATDRRLKPSEKAKCPRNVDGVPIRYASHAKRF